MKPQICAIFDKKAAAYQAPFAVKHINLAVRWFHACSKEQGHDINKWPTDYELYWVGEWDDETGKITPRTPECIMNGANLATLETN